MSTTNWRGRGKTELRLVSINKNKTWVTLIFVDSISDVISDLIKLWPPEETNILIRNVSKIIESNFCKATLDYGIKTPMHSCVKFGLWLDYITFLLAAEFESQAYQLIPHPFPYLSIGPNKAHSGAKPNILEKFVF